MPRSTTFLLGRIALAIIYIWFGLLKVLGLSPATPLVQALYHKTPIISSIPFAQFYIAFALFEIVIGILFLFPRFTKLAALLFFIHMFTTALPLLLVPGMVWQKAFVPTLEGQYIIKNVALIAVVAFLLNDRR